MQNLFAQDINEGKIYVSRNQLTSLTFHSEVTKFNFEQKNSSYKILLLDNTTISITTSQIVNEPYTLNVSEGGRRHKFIVLYKEDIGTSEQDNDFSDLNKKTVNQNTTSGNPAKAKDSSAGFYALLSQAEILKKNQQLQDAEAKYEQALELQPNNDYAAAQLAEIENLIQKQNLEYNDLIAKANNSFNLNQLETSTQLYKQALTIKPNDPFANNQVQIIGKKLIYNYNDKATNLEKNGLLDSSIFYAHKVLELNKIVQSPGTKLDALDLLSGIYKAKHNTDSLAKYLELTIATKDSLFNQQKILQVQNTAFNERLRQQEQTEQQQQLQNKIKLYSLLAALVVFFIIAFILYRTNRHKQKSYALLQKQKQEIDTQKTKAEQALDELKSTQAQLIQSEKMASLGELTAGIAHEIQNPLNFVNNFSEINKELLVEMKDEMNKGNIDDATAIANDILTNEEKINFHGKRADSIVKGMLEHSRTSTGIKEPTDINKLADEYLRLSYHGLRAKDKSFNADFKTDFDESIGKINIVPQDIGRVLLNLINNAFYAVNEKKKISPVTPEAEEQYKPLVTVKTSMNPPSGSRGVVIIVTDNGNGIPQDIVDKIFQPFFTTKPTGQGTGLGLSLSYDIIKAHDGEIKLESKEGKGSRFIIHLPIS